MTENKKYIKCVKCGILWRYNTKGVYCDCGEKIGENKKKCVYCNNLIDKMDIRCSKCDIIFQEGLKLGEDMIKIKVRGFLKDFKEEFKEND